MITFKNKGDFSKLTRYLEKVKRAARVSTLDRFGKEGVEALKNATPIDTGLTAASWSYRVEISGDSAKISFHNSNVQNGVPIAIILQYGHGTRSGRWIEGRDYINPAIQPIFDKIADYAWREVTKL